MDNVCFFPIDSLASLVFYPVALLSPEHRVRYGPLALLSLVLPYCSLLPMGVEEPEDWEFEVAARRGDETTFERLANEPAIEVEPVANELVTVECEGTKTELRTSRSGVVRFPKATYVRVARERKKHATSLTVSAAGATITVPIVAADDAVASRERRRGETFVARATSLPGSWSADLVVTDRPELHFQVRAERACGELWKWRLRMRNDSARPVSLARTLSSSGLVSFRSVDRVVLAPGAEEDDVFFLETRPTKDVFVLIGEIE